MKRTNPWAHKFRRRLTLAGVFFIGATHLSAGLSWDEDRLDLTSGIGQKVIRTSYFFTNTGKRPVAVIAVKPSCGCVATNLDKLEYAPGERGEIKVTFDLEMDKGQAIQNRTIKVITSDAPHTPKTLQLKVRVREAVNVSPELLVWRHGKPPDPKEILITAGPGVQAISLTQTAQNSNFAVEVQSKMDGQSYRLKITPQNTDSPCEATLVFDVQSPSFDHRVNFDVALKVE